MHYTLDVMVDEVEFCESKGNGNTGTAPTAQAVISAAQSQGIDTMTYGDTSDYEEILSDGDVPF
jgi:single-strand DNA-binding protein